MPDQKSQQDLEAAARAYWRSVAAKEATGQAVAAEHIAEATEARDAHAVEKARTAVGNAAERERSVDRAARRARRRLSMS